jgi:hypothetical protein
MAATHRLAAILRDARKKRTPQDEVGECDDTQFQKQLRMRAEHCTKRIADVTASIYRTDKNTIASTTSQPTMTNEATAPAVILTFSLVV